MPGEDEGAVVESESKVSDGGANFGADPVPEPIDDITFEIDEDKDEAKEVENTSEDVSGELKDTSDRVQRRINKLTYDRKEAERVRDEALGYAQNVTFERDIFKNKLSGQETFTLSEAEQRNKSQMVEAKSALRRAREEDDIDSEIEATELIGKLSADGSNIQRAKINVSRARERAENSNIAPNVGVPGPPPAVAPPEAELDPKAVGWANKTSWFGEHEGMTDYAMKQHFKMLEEGFDPQSDEYYAEVENRVEGMFPHMFQKRAPAGNGASATPGRKRSGQTVAPAGNTYGSATKSNKTVVTTSEQAVAQGLGISNEAYAREKARLARERVSENA